jgi:hypothetical protein
VDGTRRSDDGAVHSWAKRTEAQEVPRKHLADGLRGAANSGAGKAKADPLKDNRSAASQSKRCATLTTVVENWGENLARQRLSKPIGRDGSPSRPTHAANPPLSPPLQMLATKF